MAAARAIGRVQSRERRKAEMTILWEKSMNKQSSSTRHVVSAPPTESPSEGPGDQRPPPRELQRIRDQASPERTSSEEQVPEEIREGRFKVVHRRPVDPRLAIRTYKDARHDVT